MNQARPCILNVYKPPGPSSQDIIKKFKRKLKHLGKIGHFGTLDPFAEGVLMIGIAGGQRLNEYIHECLPKTYLAKGILGKETETGDLTVEPSQVDESEYLYSVISKFEKDFLQKTFCEKFLGPYMQSPHKYSAAKFEGKALHEWARQGVEIKKEKKERHVYKIEIVKYEFPELWVRYTVSSGTYIRTLFSDCARELGTLGVLKDLIREEVGGSTIGNALYEKDWEQDELPLLNIDTVLPFSSIVFEEKEVNLYKNGVKLKEKRALRIDDGSLKEFPYYWARDVDGQIYGLCEIIDGVICSRVNFSF